MANKRLVDQLTPNAQKVEEETLKVLESIKAEEMQKLYDEALKDFRVDTIVKGKILRTVGDVVLVDIGYKSEGAVPKSDFTHPNDIREGEELEVYLESIEDETGLVALSKQKADRIRGWERIIRCNREGDPLKGRVIRKVKGGLLVDVGVPVFLPASQVDTHKVEDIGEFIGKEIEVKIIKIDEKRMNVIVSRKKSLDDQRNEQKLKLMSELKEGDQVRGIVKNFADYGAFIDIGGCDALLYLSDISWARIGHPSEVLRIGQDIVVKVLKIDRDREQISVGLKQLQKNPWTEVSAKYPVGMKTKGKVVNVVPYGVFVELEPGIEGLVHISEMSWTKPPSHPAEMVKVGDEVQVAVINVNIHKQEIGLSMKQASENPWEVAAAKYTTGSKVKGKVKRFVNYGAFVEVEDGIEGLLHTKDISWTKRISHPSELLQKGQELELTVLSIEKAKKKLALGLKQLQENPWETTIPTKYAPGVELEGKVTKVVSFGVFVELEKDLEGLIHSSRMPKKDIVLASGDVVKVRVEKLDLKEGKIGLTLVDVVSKAEASGGAAPAAGGETPAPQG